MTPTLIAPYRFRTVVLQTVGFALAYALLALVMPSRASAQSLRITGDLDRLIACQPVFAALDAVFSKVRERTDYA